MAIDAPIRLTVGVGVVGCDRLGLTFAWWLSGGRREIGVFPDRIGTIPDAGSGVSPMDAGTRTVIHVDERVLVLALPHLIPDANGYGCLKLANLEIVSR